MFNRVIIAGNPTRDPEFWESVSGVPVTRLPVACNVSFKRPDGETVTETLFINSVVFGQQAETEGAKSWRKHWPHLITLFEYPNEIRRVIYTANAIESLNSVIRKAIDNRKIFPHDQSALKVEYLAIDAAAKQWTMPIRNWKPALNRFMIAFAGRIPETL